MKKNDVMGYVAYFLMLGIACGMGFGFIRPFVSQYDASKPMNTFLFIGIAVVVAIILNAILIELGHLSGAKMGHYKVVSCDILGLKWTHQDNGHKKFGFGEFDGITGETRVVPLDDKKSNPRHMIYMPLLFLLIEVVLMAVLIGVGKAFGANNPVMYWWGELLGVVILTVAGMIYIYDIFPAALDAKNDGYLLGILTNETNTQAYNQMLLAEDKMKRGEPVGNTPVYDQVTDFTARVNNVTLYQKLSQRDFDGALAILEKTIACKNKVSANVYHEAMAQKTAILLYTRPVEEAKEAWVSLPYESKKYVAGLSSIGALRACVLASGLIEGSLSETENALNKADTMLKKAGDDKKATEEALLKDAVMKVLEAHKDDKEGPWNLDDYGYSLAKAAPETKPAEATKPEDKKPK
jgi:hypothetical protein